MNGLEKSDLPIVAGKLANGAALAAKESVERRGGARENVDLQNTVRTQSREAVSRAQARIKRNGSQHFSIISPLMSCERGSSV
jgi:hypothetical protein